MVRMKVRDVVCSFLVVCVVWQVTLIVIELKDLFVGIDFNLNENVSCFNGSSSRIPRIIHQMWKDNNLSTYPIKHSHNKWKLLYPNFTVRLWTDAHLQQLLNFNEYRHLKSIYDSYSYSIQRADLGRLLILHHAGGIYADLDVFPNSNQLECLLLTNSSFYAPRSSSGNSLINHFLISEKNSSILTFILHQIKRKHFYEKIYLLPYLQVFSTGSFFLTKSVHEYFHLNPTNELQTKILSETNLLIYVTHEQGRSWHLIDGFILNLVEDHKKNFLTILTVLLFLVLLFVRYRYVLLIKIQKLSQ